MIGIAILYIFSFGMAFFVANLITKEATGRSIIIRFFPDPPLGTNKTCNEFKIRYYVGDKALWFVWVTYHYVWREKRVGNTAEWIVCREHLKTARPQ